MRRLRHVIVLDRTTWLPRAEAHRERAERWTRPHLERRRIGADHPVEDFLFEYYNYSPGALARWHPGLGVGLVDSPEHAALGAYATADGVSSVDASRLKRRLPGLRWTQSLLERTRDAEPRWSCFGLHEWAMVHGASDERRHTSQPLRLGADGTDEVVRSHSLQCTHVDAFRFFTPTAAPLNAHQLTRDDQIRHEQPGCVHVSMDLYRLAFRLMPFAESTIVLDAFELALDARQVDMRASPYDVTNLGLTPIPVETAEGKAEYVREQRRLAALAEPVRARLLAEVTGLLERGAAVVGAPSTAGGS
ncbi:3-methyladenine DNA glycosylase [Aeromicrobium alkaliterrae]|uniref:3-methyladenine DNA glycosylase n=1 Tax=Aeromicrobium alkaliterrae TaxID=302168 RepID=A0ABN2JI10_9ACTN